MIRDRGIVVAPGSDQGRGARPPEGREARLPEVRGILFSSLFGRTRIERTESAGSVEALLEAFPGNAPITLVLPGHLFMVRTVTLPFTDPNTVRKTLPFELEGTVPLPVEDLLVDGVPSTATGAGPAVMALAIPRTTVAAYLDSFPRGRRPVRVVPDFMALLSLGRTIGREGGVHAILDVGPDSASLVVVGADGPLAMRSVDGGADPAQVVAWVDATLDPLARQGHEITTLYVTGAAARAAVPLLDRVATIRPVAVTVTGLRGTEWLAWSMLAGAAISASAFPRFNLLGADPGRSGVARTVRRLAIGAGILLVLGTADLSVRYATAARTLSAFKAESRRAFVSVMPGVRTIVKEEVQLQVALVAARSTRDRLLGTPSPSPLGISRGLARIAAEHPDVRVRETVIEGTRATIAGDLRGLGAEGLKKIFASIEGARDVRVDELVQGVEPTSARFRVTVDVR